VMQYALDRFASRYEEEPRVLAVGPAAMHTDNGAIASAPVKKGALTAVDCWAGRGGFGTKLLQQHGIVGIIYGGTWVDEDFRDRMVADQWFQDRYEKKMAAKDFEATTKYRYDPAFNTGGTFGVNFATMNERIIAFNYRTTLYEQVRSAWTCISVLLWIITSGSLMKKPSRTKQQKTCGEPCAAVCKKMHNHYQERLRTLSDDGTIVRGVRPARRRAAERQSRRLRLRRDICGWGSGLADGLLWQMASSSQRSWGWIRSRNSHRRVLMW
jgi:glyceraldehyde-3-phosphate dehydrogenase (ferredoxin)